MREVCEKFAEKSLLVIKLEMEIIHAIGQCVCGFGYPSYTAQVLAVKTYSTVSFIGSVKAVGAELFKVTVYAHKLVHSYDEPYHRH